MTSVRKCLRCGADVHPDAPGGLCPRCLVGLSFATETEVSGEADSTTRPMRAPVEEPRSMEEVAKLFPRLEILKYLGRGGMGLVYQARQPQLDRLVALKMLAKREEADAHFAERFAREARALARLNHPNIVSVYDFGEVAGHYYLLIEFVDGVNLRQLLQTGKITPEQALVIVPRICDALQYAHSQGVVHRDIKPENILLDKQGSVKIADFGIAKILDRKPGEILLTEDTQRIGTPHYMAPEQVENPKSVDHRADIYSLGVVFYEMLTGELPLGKFARPSEKAEIDARLDQVVFHALEKDREHRYQQAREVKTDVETIAGGRNENFAELVAGRIQSFFPGRASARFWLWLLALGVGTLAIALLLLFGKQITSRLKGPTSSPMPAVIGEITFPADAAVVDVTRPPYNAVSDGNTDATAAIQQALTDFCGKHAIIYLPKGTYLLSSPLRWGGGSCDFQGQGPESTILRLKNACPGFGDLAAPQPTLSTGPKGTERYFNSLRDLTVNTGTDNPGAIGVQFAASWVGCIRDVQIRSDDGQGVTGLDLARIESLGSLLVKNLTVRGFRVGVHSKEVLVSLAFEHIFLKDQQQVGFLNDGPSLSIRQLITKGRVPGFQNDGLLGLAVIVDSEFEGLEGAKAQAAIINSPGMFVRNARVTGFALAIAHHGLGPTNIPGAAIKEWSSRPLPNSNHSLQLPVQETPEVPWDAAAEWANPVAFGASPNGTSDASESIQRAIDCGKRTVYLPHGEYVLRRPILLRGKLARFIGCGAVLHLRPSDRKSPIFSVADGEAPVLLLERLQVDSPDSVLPYQFLDNRSRRTLVLRDCGGVDSEFTGSGELFLENVSGRVSFHGQRVWARQISQGSAVRMGREQWWHLRNESGRVWILGQMTQGPGPIIFTSGGGQSELLGGLTYSSAGAEEQPEPAFVVDRSALSVSLNEVSHANFAYLVLVRRVSRDGHQTDVLTRDQAPGGASGSLIPHFATE